MANPTTARLVSPKRVRLPSDYVSPMSTNQKLDFAHAAAEHVRTTMGLTPVAASVTGSRLRGVDSAASDVDVLVLVAEKTRARTMLLPHLGDVEGQVQSLSSFAELLSTSVPYVEFLGSPFMVTDPTYAPFLRSLRPNWTVLAVHTERLVYHVMARETVPYDKRLRTAACAFRLLESGSPLCPRDYALVQTLPEAATAWVRESMETVLGGLSWAEDNHQVILGRFPDGTFADVINW